MTTYFTIDRKRRLEPNLTLEVKRCEDPELPPELRNHLEEMFPGGVSDHGRRFFILGQFLEVERVIELTWEFLRRAHFPNRPSRYVCTYAWRTLEEAQRFRSQSEDTGVPIWEVESETCFIANMNLLNLQFSSIATSRRAHIYWQGLEAADDTYNHIHGQTWEVLLPPSAKVIRQVID